MKPVGGDAGDHFGGDAAPGECLAHGEEAAGAGDRGEHGVDIEGFDRPEVDHFDFPSVMLEVVCGADRFMDHGAVGDDGGVFSGADDAGLSDGKVVAVDRFGFEPALEEFVFAEDDGIIECDRIDEHVIGV